MSKNQLRQKLKRNETCYGLWVTLESPSITEVAVALGVDWICVDMEHGHLDFHEAMAHIRAVRDSKTSVIVRVPELGQSPIKRALDLGANGVIVPLIRSRQELETAMKFGRYPPYGIRGVSGERAVKWGLESEEYLSQANEETLIIPLIETREAAENIDDILSLPTLEAIFFGPADLSASFGYLGQWEGPKVADRILDIRAKAKLKGIASGIMSTDIEDGIRRKEQRFDMVGVGNDVGLMLRSLRQALEKMRVSNV